jgi:hypothetical protein
MLGISCASSNGILMANESSAASTGLLGVFIGDPSGNLYGILRSGRLQIKEGTYGTLRKRGRIS